MVEQDQLPAAASFLLLSANSIAVGLGFGLLSPLLLRVRHLPD